MINGCIKSNPVFVIGLLFQDQDDAGLFAGLERVVERLADCLCPLIAEIEFDGVGGSQAVAAGFIREHVLGFAVLLLAPFFLVEFLRMQAGCGGTEKYC